MMGKLLSRHVCRGLCASVSAASERHNALNRPLSQNTAVGTVRGGNVTAPAPSHRATCAFQRATARSHSITRGHSHAPVRVPARRHPAAAAPGRRRPTGQTHGGTAHTAAHPAPPCTRRPRLSAPLRPVKAYVRASELPRTANGRRPHPRQPASPGPLSAAPAH